MLLLLIGLLVVAILVYFSLVKPLSYWKKKGVEQENFLKAFWFNWFGICGRQSLVSYVQNMYYQFPNRRYSGVYQLNVPVLVLKDPELMKLVLIKDFDHFTDRRTYIPDDVDPLWANSLFSLKGSKWRNMRSTLSPAFTSSKMKGMFILMKKCAENFIDHFSKQDENIIPVDLKDIFSRFCNDAIATTAFGVEVDSLANPDNLFYKMGQKATNFNSFKKSFQAFGYLVCPRLYKLLNLKLYDDDIAEFFRNLIDETIEAREKQGIIRPDMINLLMEARSGVAKKDESNVEDAGYATVEESVQGKLVTDITNEDITAQALIFFFAGFESLSSLMCFMAYELAVNQDIQERLRQEIQESSEQTGGKLTYEVLVKMKYMDMVVTEVLRKWPPQVIGERICTEPYTIQPITPEEKPLHLEKGTYLIFPEYSIQRDPEYFPDPDRFDPERFSDENKGKIKPLTYQPFGHGPRNCIGSRFALLEAKVLFYYILSKFEIVPTEKTTIPLVLANNIVVLAVEKGFDMGLKRLEK
ncbi:cytochrome P450 9e2 isoform X2 [Leptinotarsa decemlineata]|nr:cytochrome P450 9e2-like [Leptinotarsa decemlineata]XP_023030480.1 cytochrome P450 9e2-like [Leptinotarsa decemlineata]XP_023030481.1 cytochrome P450 9e2-like [Leptinotarsa decemlineata]XP_023030482.1 cytochrome P450 9e2-like [Leptinotarsa decemlineata]